MERPWETPCGWRTIGNWSFWYCLREPPHLNTLYNWCFLFALCVIGLNGKWCLLFFTISGIAETKRMEGQIGSFFVLRRNQFGKLGTIFARIESINQSPHWMREKKQTRFLQFALRSRIRCDLHSQDIVVDHKPEAFHVCYLHFKFPFTVCS